MSWLDLTVIESYNAMSKAKKAKYSIGDENELKSYCRVHQALNVLQQQVIAHRMSIEPIMKTRANNQTESLGAFGSNLISIFKADGILGVSTAQRVSKKINTNKLRRAVIAYDRTVESYAEEFKPDHPPQKALSIEAILEKEPDDLFWSDVLFDSRNEPWASDPHCQKGMIGIRMGELKLKKL